MWCTDDPSAVFTFHGRLALCLFPGNLVSVLQTVGALTWDDHFPLSKELQQTLLLSVEPEGQVPVEEHSGPETLG